MSLESLLARLRASALSIPDVSDVSDVQPYGGAACSRYGRETADVSDVSAAARFRLADTPDTAAKKQTYQPEPYGQAACTADTSDTSRSEEGAASVSAARWLADVARHLDTTPAALLAAGVILAEEVASYYRDRDPHAMADALRRVHPDRFTAREPDDRRHCAACMNLAGTRCQARRLLVMDDLPRRCSDYLPTPDDPDQRPGRDRWPSLLIPLEASP